MLRERHRALELKLAGLIRLGEENDAIGAKVQRWTRDLLLASDPEQLPTIVSDGLAANFSVPQVAMRLWELRGDFSGRDFAQPVASDVVTLASSMTQPYCGPNSDFQAATWLPDGGRDTRSIALLPLRKGSDPKSFGLLVLGSADADRFHSGMGTSFLERIAETSSAALARLAG